MDKNKKELKEFKKPENKTIHPGVKPKYNNLEVKLYNFVEFNRKAVNIITIKTLITEMIRLD